jgi:transposase InsO family protein
MPWKEVTTMQEKERFLASIPQWKGSFRSLCREFGISPKTGYKRLNRYKQCGLESLKELSRKPKNSPNKTARDIEELIVKIRQLHPAWSGEKLRNYLYSKGYQQLPVEKTIDRILKRHGLITIEESEKHKPWKRFEHENPNDLWQMDFKGHFATGTGRCHPLTLLDDHSRYSLLIKACADEQAKTVKAALIEVFRQYGLPLGMTMDNGSPWGYSGAQLHTGLTAWLIHLGIYVGHSRPRHPQTQGKLERFHRTLKLELLSRYTFDDCNEAQKGFDWWQKIYNEERPHEAIGHAVPAKRYRESERLYPEKLPEIEYEGGMIVRKVQQSGFINYKGKEYRVGAAFYGHPVGLKEAEEDGLMDVFFCHQRVVKIDLNL